MKKRNVFVQTAIASALLAFFGVAHANSVTVTARSVANEAFGSAIVQPTVVAGAISLPTLQYSFNTPGGIVVNPGGSVKVVFTLAGGTTDTTGVFSAANNVTISAGISSFTPTVTSTGSTHTVTLTNGTVGNLTIGIGASVSLVSTALDAQYRVIGVTKGTNVTVTGSALNGADNSVLEAATAAVNAITFAEAVTAASTASTSTNKINLNTTPTPGTDLVTNAPVSFGGVTLTNSAGTQVKLDAAGAADTDITAATATAYALSGTFTVGKASGSFTPGMTVGLFTDQTCATPITSGGLTTTNAPVGAISASTTSITLAYTGLAPAELNAGVFLCGDYSAVAAATALNEITPTLAFTYDKASTSYSDEVVAAFNGFALTTNGQTKDVRSYIPAATTGYTSFVRVINTGSVDAAVTGQFVNEDGTTSASGVIIATLKAGGSKTLTASEIETAMGVAPTATDRPRLRLTAPTSGLDAQSFFLTNANGNFSDATGAQ